MTRPDVEELAKELDVKFDALYIDDFEWQQVAEFIIQRESALQSRIGEMEKRRPIICEKHDNEPGIFEDLRNNCIVCDMQDSDAHAQEEQNLAIRIAGEWEQNKSRIATLESQIDTAKAAFDKYARHHGMCEAVRRTETPDGTMNCICGFDEALSKLSKNGSEG